VTAKDNRQLNAFVFRRGEIVMNTRIFAILVCVLIIPPATVNADTFYVDDSAAGLNDGSDWTNAFNLIQSGIAAAAVTGDTVIVATGTYSENLDMLGKEVHLTSTEPTNPDVVVATVINGGQADSVITCESGETVDTIIEGFLITNGKAVKGGGVYCLNSAPTISYCIISDNLAYHYVVSPPAIAEAFGGGIYVESGGLAISNTTISYNFAEAAAGSSPCYGRGGGIYSELSTITILNCNIKGNRAKCFTNIGGRSSNYAHGGAIYCERTSMDVIDCAIKNNFACTYSDYLNLNAQSYGGAMYITALSDPSFTGCEIIGNTALAFSKGTASYSYGGAVYSTTSSPVFTDCQIAFNTSMTASSSNQHGGGIYTVGGSGNLTVLNSLICSNSPNHQEGSGFTDGGGNTYTDNYPKQGTGLTGDLDDDGDVDLDDFAIFAADWLKPTL
jgi:hypothetical protein